MKSLNQFRSYSTTIPGIALGFNIDSLLSSFPIIAQHRLCRCLYDDIEQSEFVDKVIDECIAETKKVDKMDDDLLDLLAARIVKHAPVIKHRSFSEEKEWRLIFDYLSPIQKWYKFRNGNSYIVPYIEIPIDIMKVLDSIVIGPTPNQMLTKKSIIALCEHEGLFEHELRNRVVLSDIPFRKW